MSFRQGASWGSSAVDEAGSQVRSTRVGIALRKPTAPPAGGTLGDPVSRSPGSSEPCEQPPTRRGRTATLGSTVVAAVNGCLPGTPSDQLRADHAQTIPRTVVIGYASADAQHRDRASADLRRQTEEITSECERRGLRLLEVVQERERQHRRPLERPGLGYALERIAAADAGGLVVADLSRVSHSLAELGRVLEWLASREVRFVAARSGLDTEEEAGRLAAETVIDVSRWERQRLAERTRSGMRAARRKGPGNVADNPELRDRIVAMRAEGMTLQAIADELNADGIPTVRGGAKWRPSSVQSAAGYQRPSASQRQYPRLWRT